MHVLSVHIYLFSSFDLKLIVPVFLSDWTNLKSRLKVERGNKVPLLRHSAIVDTPIVILSGHKYLNSNGCSPKTENN